MASNRKSARQTHIHRSSEGSRIQPKSKSSSTKVDRDTAHRSAPVASKASDSQYAIPRERKKSVPFAEPPDRDSIVSIVDDPFFQRFDDHADDEADEFDPFPTTPEATEPRDDNVSAQRWPPPRRESLTIGHSTFRPQAATAMESLNIAVIGATGVGKSSFVQRVLGLTRPPMSNASSVRMVVDNNTYGVTLLELDLEYFDMNPAQPIQWPKQVNGHIVPRVDGALILYDVMNKESILELPQTLASLTNSGLPAILVACKCDNPESARQVDAQGMANHDVFRSCVATYNISSNVPERARACLGTILRAAVANRKDIHAAESGMSRRRAASATNLETPDASNTRPLSQHSKHSRASSDLSLLRGFPLPAIPDHYRGQPSRSPRLGYPTSPQPGSSAFGAEGPDEDSQQTVSSMLRTPGIRLDRAPHDSFLDMDESDAESFRYSDDIPILQRNDDNFFEKPTKAAGVSFSELVDRLVAPKMSRADNNFSDVFLCLYRKFAAPGELFTAILTRLDRVRDDKSTHHLSKAGASLGLIEVIAKWVSLYPGDFARPATRRNLEELIRHLSTEPIFSIAAQHIRRHLEFNVIEDDDTGWAKSDEMADKVASKVLLKEKSRSISEMSNSMNTSQLDSERSLDGGPSGGSDYSNAAPSSSVGSYFQFHSYEEYEREAATMEPTDVLPMNKFRYHIFIDTPDDDIADEMTRIDWVMFSSIRIRDFVRHVSLPLEQRGKCKSLKNVNRMIHHFNHVAKWVANLILLRDKAKHRAQMLEKFMNIALKLRRLNNYNGLAAVLAGINGTAIHRLTQTWALVGPEVQRSFAKLVILMGTQKSHFAYRLAWENSPLPRIPYIPLHRRDLVSAEEGSRTFVGAQGDRINWKKFEVLGEVLLPIMKSQGSAYPNLTTHDSARQLILDCRMPTDDEDIYQRSIQVETSSGGLTEPAKKKFPWFAK